MKFDYNYMVDCDCRARDMTISLEDRLRAEFEYRFLNILEAKALNNDKALIDNAKEKTYSFAQTLCRTGVIGFSELWEIRNVIFG